MTAFTVFGVTRTRAAKLARSALTQRYCVSANSELVTNNIDRETEIQIETAQILKVAPLFSAPQFCRDWRDLAYKQYPTEYYRLLIYQHVPKLNSAGREIIRKKSNKVMMTWEEYAQQD